MNKLWGRRSYKKRPQQLQQELRQLVDQYEGARRIMTLAPKSGAVNGPASKP